MLRKQQGISLIELIAFIIIIGIIASGTLVGAQRMLTTVDIPNAIMQANQLAQGRLEIILQQRKLIGFSNFNDPCSNATPPTVCTALSTFASNNNLTVATPTISADGTAYKLITVSVSGAGSATLYARVANYDNT